MQGREITDEQLEKFLKKLKSTFGNVSQSAQFAKISRAAVYALKKEDKDFSEKWNDVIESCIEAAEQELYRRSVQGVKTPKFYKGSKIATVKEFSDRLLEFYLKARRPDVYRERVDINNNHSGVLGVDLKAKISSTWKDHKNNLPPIDDDASDNRNDSE